MPVQGASVSQDRAALTQQVKQASDIVAVLSSYLTVYPAGSAFKAICPFHNDTRPSLHIDPKWQNFKCWSCGKNGDVFTFVSEFEKLSFMEARELLARRAGINLQGSPSPVENQRRGQMLDAMKWAEATYKECLLDNPMGERARLYLAGRKLNGTTIRSFGLGFAPAAGDWLVRAAKALGLRGNGRHTALDRFFERGLLAGRDADVGNFENHGCASVFTSCSHGRGRPALSRPRP